MGQQEIILWLRDRRLCGDESYWSVKEIEQAIINDVRSHGSGGGVWRQINKLYAYGFLEIDDESRFRRRFRLADKHLVIGDAV